MKTAIGLMIIALLGIIDGTKHNVNFDALFPKRDSIFDKQEHILSSNSKIKILSSEFQQLDTFTINWHPSNKDLELFFQTANPINHIEAARIIEKQYYPFAITGELIHGDTLLHFTLNPAGVAILYNPESDSTSFYRNNLLAKKNFHFPKRTYPEWTIKILRKDKRIGKICETDSLYTWAKTWDLTVTEINEYISLCEKDMIVRLYQIFMNYPCDINGYAIWNENLYYYSLECSGMTWMTKLIGTTSDEENFGFGCYDIRGLKYVYTIENNLEEN